MTKNEFIQIYLRSTPKKITTFFKLDEFQREDVWLEVREIQLQKMADFFHPWKRKGNEFVESIEEAIEDTKIIGVRLRETDKVDLSVERKEKITAIRQLLNLNFDPFPIMTDTRINKSLILDGNHTLSALHRIGSDLLIPIVEIIGESMSRVVIDFEIIKREQWEDS